MVTYTRSYNLKHSANQNKIQEMCRVLEPYNQARSQTSMLLLNLLKQNNKWSTKISTKDHNTGLLTQRQYRDALYDTQKSLKQWVEQVMYEKIKNRITKSNLDNITKYWLYRINANRAWWFKELVVKEKDEYGKEKKVSVPEKYLNLSKTLFRRIQKEHPFNTDYSKNKSITLDNAAVLEESNVDKTTGEIKKHANLWLKVSKYASYGNILVPLHFNKYYNSKSGELSNYVRITFDNYVYPTGFKITVLRKNEIVDKKTSGKTLGVDYGLSGHVFATSEGRLLGQSLYQWLLKQDEIITSLVKSLQRQNIPLRANKRYKRLVHRVREYVKNEVNRCLNILSHDEVKELVVERLDFRGGGLSKRLNRILSNAGRATVRKKLTSLSEEKGLQVTEVNPAYTSQECSGCGFIYRLNRKNRLFNCRFCGLKLHADVNAARVILSRRSRSSEQLNISKKEIMVFYDETFLSNWGVSPLEFVRRHDLPSRVKPKRTPSNANANATQSS